MVDVVDGEKLMFSLPELARKSDVPESTCRRYIQQFPEYFTSSAVGRVKRYHPECVQALRTIKTMYEQGSTKDEILVVLSGKFTQEITIHQSPTTDTTQDVGPIARDFVSELMRAVRGHGGQQLGPDSEDYILKKIAHIEKRLDELEAQKPFWKKLFK